MCSLPLVASRDVNNQTQGNMDSLQGYLLPFAVKEARGWAKLEGRKELKEINERSVTAELSQQTCVGDRDRAGRYEGRQEGKGAKQKGKASREMGKIANKVTSLLCP